MPSFNPANADANSTRLFNNVLEHIKEKWDKPGCTQNNPIRITDDDEYDVSAWISQQIEDDYDTDAESGTEAGSPTPGSPLYSSRPLMRNNPVPVQDRMEKFERHKMVIKPDDMLEIAELRGNFRCSFLRVTMIYNSAGQVIIRGIPYTRARRTMGMIPSGQNELVEVLNIDEDDERPYHHQGAVEISPANIYQKRDYRITNKSRDDLGCSLKKDFSGEPQQRVEETGMLTIRYRMVSRYQTSHQRAQLKAVGRDLIQFSEDEICDPSLKVSDEIKLNVWRGTKIRGGSYSMNSRHCSGLSNNTKRMVYKGWWTADYWGVETQSSYAPKSGATSPNDENHGSIDVEMQGSAKDGTVPLKKGQQYTFADIFCGCGGASRGAEAARFRVTLACDSDNFACRSFQENFPQTDLREIDIHDLLVLLETNQVRVDVLHISPPCQVWSPVHTVFGQNDDANMAVMFSVFQVIQKLRPRIVTLEQTFGILQSRFAVYFHLLLNCFTSLEYSVSWRYVCLNTWGVPQPRKRVIMVASCPGEAHPSIPGPSGIPVSVNRSLATIRPNDTLHNPRELLNQPAFPKASYNGDVPFNRTILCSNPGEEFYHPSGKRPFTVRELASLQTFPPDHKFVGSTTRVKKQIGNAFPSRAVEYLYTHIRNHLLASDGVIEEDGENDDDDDLMIL
jgi:DNA (cytosine-5)-methyltransferase 1